MELCILIPARNEETSLPSTIVNIQEQLNEKISFNFLVINDHSTDDTLKVLEDLKVHYNLNYINNQNDGGVGNAIRYGLKHWRGDVLAICMADNSDNPGDILKSYHLIEEGVYDCVFGSRFIKGGKTINYPVKKLILNRIFNVMVKYISSYDYNDYTNIFKVYSRKSIETIQPINSSNFSIGLEMSLKAFKSGLKIGIIPITWQQRKSGTSKLKLLSNFNQYIGTLKKHI